MTNWLNYKRSLWEDQWGSLRSTWMTTKIGFKSKNRGITWWDSHQLNSIREKITLLEGIPSWSSQAVRGSSSMSKIRASSFAWQTLKIIALTLGRHSISHKSFKSRTLCSSRTRSSCRCSHSKTRTSRVSCRFWVKVWTPWRTMCSKLLVATIMGTWRHWK